MAETKAANAMPVGKSDSKTNAILAWLFAPITSLIWMNDADEFLRYHAKQSLAFSLAMWLGHIVWLIVYVVGTAVTLGFGACICWIPWMVWGFVHLGGTIYGLVKANNGERWEVPVVGKMMK